MAWVVGYYVYMKTKPTMNLLTQLQTSEPVAFGGFSELHIIDGKAVKVLEDGCYLATSSKNATSRTSLLKLVWLLKFTLSLS